MKKIFLIITCLLFASNVYAQEKKPLPEQASEKAKEIIHNPGKLRVEKLEKIKFSGRVKSFILDKEGRPKIVETIKKERLVNRTITHEKVLFLRPDGTVKKELVQGVREEIRVKKDSGIVVKLKKPEIDKKGLPKKKGDKVKIEIFDDNGDLIIQDEVDYHVGYKFSSDYTRYVATEGETGVIYLRDSVNKKEKEIKLFGETLKWDRYRGAGVEFSPNGELIGVSSRKDKNGQRYFILFDKDGNERWRKNKKRTARIIFSPKSNFIVSGDNLFTKDGDEVGHNIDCDIFSPDESYCSYTFGMRFGAVNTTTGEKIWEREIIDTDLVRENHMPRAITADSDLIIFETGTYSGSDLKSIDVGFMIINKKGDLRYEYTAPISGIKYIDIQLHKNKLFLILDNEVQKFAIPKLTGGRL